MSVPFLFFLVFNRELIHFSKLTSCKDKSFYESIRLFYVTILLGKKLLKFLAEKCKKKEEKKLKVTGFFQLAN